MGKKSRLKKERRRDATRTTPAPRVHAKVAVAEKDLGASSALIKPALLYADDVTIYSPSASMLASFQGLQLLKTRHERFRRFLEIIDAVPSFADELKVSREMLQQVEILLRVDPHVLRALGRAHGVGEKMDSLVAGMEHFDRIWDEDLPRVLEDAVAVVGAEEVAVAVSSGAVTVAELAPTSDTEVIADALRRATGSDPDDTVDRLVLGFVSRITEMLQEPDSFPLLDAESSGLVRTLENDAALEASSESMRRAGEIKSAATFMGYLPSFPQLSVDEVLDLRTALATPLIKFRGELASLNSDFASRAIDDTFPVELERAWRERVAPALADIREALAEHRLLRGAASVVLGDPRRILLEAGGVLAAAQQDVVSLSGVLMAAAAIGVPAADVAGRAFVGRRAAQAGARRHSFYFLHHLSEQAKARL